MVLFEQSIKYLIVVMVDNFKTRTLNFDDSTIGDKSSTFLKSKECDKKGLSTIKAGDRWAIYRKMEKFFLQLSPLVVFLPENIDNFVAVVFE